jgi:hypothetical protein
LVTGGQGLPAGDRAYLAHPVAIHELTEVASPARRADARVRRGGHTSGSTGRFAQKPSICDLPPVLCGLSQGNTGAPRSCVPTVSAGRGDHTQ